MLKHWLGLGIISGQTLADDLLVGIIKTVVAQRPLLQACDEFVTVGAGEMKNAFHLNVLLHEDRLGDIAGNPVENEVIPRGFEFTRLGGLANRLVPETHRHFIGHELPLAGIFQEGGSQFRGGIQRAKNIPAGAVVEARHLAKDLSLCSLAASGGSKNQNSTIA